MASIVRRTLQPLDPRTGCPVAQMQQEAEAARQQVIRAQPGMDALKSSQDREDALYARAQGDRARQDAKQQGTDLMARQREDQLLDAKNQREDVIRRETAGGGAVGTPGTANTNAMGAFDSLMSKYGDKFGGGDSSSSSSTGGVGGGTIGGTTPRAVLDTGAIEAGDAASYSRAKDQVGASTQGLMKSLESQFAGRGLRGSSMEGRAVGAGLESAQGELADVSRGQAIQGSDRAADLVKTQYGGDVTMRGQDLAENAAIRSNNTQAQQSKIASIMGLMNAFSGMAKY